jgi:hypothetical protein
MDYDIVCQGCIEGDFGGFDGDALFHLSNGTYWLQAEYKYWYYYAYRPEVEVYVLGGRSYLRIVGQSESVAIEQVSGIIESRISGAFTGWKGDSEYELTNGQVWKQARYRYQYRYKYRPHVLIYSASSGKIMDVEGCRAVVKRVR